MSESDKWNTVPERTMPTHKPVPVKPVPQKPVPTPPNNPRRVKELFHQCWGNNKDCEYHKDNWMELQRLLQDAGVDV